MVPSQRELHTPIVPPRIPLHVDIHTMAFQHERLLSIIEFAQQSARLSAKPAATVAQHGDFRLFEHEAQGGPGLRFNQTEEGTEREIWLAVERLRELPPPACQSELLKPWLNLTQGSD